MRFIYGNKVKIKLFELTPLFIKNIMVKNFQRHYKLVMIIRLSL